MYSSWVPVILTLSQALLTTALPQGRSGEWSNWDPWVPSPDYSDHDSSTISSDLLTVSAAETTASSQASSNASDPPSNGNSSVPVSTTVIVDPNLLLQTVTISSVASEQSPTSTDGVISAPDTTGSVITSLQTDGRPTVQPFPTSLPNVTESTLQPSETTAPFGNSTFTSGPPSITETVTVPVSTVESTIVNSTVVSIPVSTVISATQVTVINSTVTSDGTTFTTSSVGTTVVASTATALNETTLTVPSTVTETLSATLSSGSIPTIQPSPSCVFDVPCDAQNVFQPVALGSPPSNIKQVDNHPVPRLGINNNGNSIPTNKFYANFFLGSQGSPAFVMPYGLTWSKGGGNAQSWGMAVSHLEESQKVFGPPNDKIPGKPASYFINPIGIQSCILSAAEMGESTVLTSDSLDTFSANINLLPNQGSSSSITFPIVQGMAFVTAEYTSLQPEIQSSVFFRSISAASDPKSGVYKYRIALEDGTNWLLYAIPSQGLPPAFKLVSSTLLQGINSWSGVIQLAKLPSSDDEALYDDACGAYPTAGAVNGYAQDTQGQYSLSWTKSGQFKDNTTLLMFALPHHVESFNKDTAGKVKSLQLQTTSKGIATAVAADYWVMAEQLPTTMGFAPWQAGSDEVKALSVNAVAAIQKVAAVEASQDMSAQTNLNSMYYSGKGLSKFATIVYTMNELSDQKSLATAALAQLKSAFSVFTNNQQQYPLYYDTQWKGVVSSASYETGDGGADFGNSFYNDHHFHYGYFIHAAAIIGSLDPSWLTENRDYINSLVRDVSNPSKLDTYFPVFRSFDWYHGHSWAKGLFESSDGKDQESSSEDAMFAYALKMWGKTTGDAAMEARGNLMLAVLARSLQHYFLMDEDNKNQPASFIGNRVTGILFENKADHVTYFGANFEYVQGIHMIPLMPFSTLTRTKQFVTNEWNQYFADGAVSEASNISGGWKGILYGNLAIVNPQAAYNFFSQDNFDSSWLDGGASRTWYLAYAAGLGGAS